MTFSPLPHQRLAIDFLEANPITMLAMGCGLGKTSATLKFASDMMLDGTSKGVLVVAPLRVVNMTWPAEREKWSAFHWLPMYSLRTEEGKAAWNRGVAAVYLINYDMLQQFAAWGLAKRKTIPVDTVVWDEVGFSKSPTSKRINAVRPFRPFFVRHIGLTGTLASQGYLDLFAMYRLLDGGQRLGKHFTHYRSNYFDSDYMGYNWTLRSGAKERIQELISDITLVLRTEDYLNIPETVHVDIDVTLPPPLRKQYDELEKKLLLTIDEREIVASNAAVLSGKLLQFVSGAVYDGNRDVVKIHDLKIDALRKLKEKLKKPMLVVVSYLHEKERIVESIPGAELFSEERLDAWNAGKIPMWVIHPKSCGHGLCLEQGSSSVVWFTFTHSRELFDQTNARLIRTGQTEITTIYRIMGVDTYDWCVSESLRDLGDSQKGLMNSLRSLKRLRTVGK